MPVRVLVWPSPTAPNTDLDTFLRSWRHRGWRVRRHEPRVLERPTGPTFGALLVLERTPHPEQRLCRRPLRRPLDRREEPARANTKT